MSWYAEGLPTRSGALSPSAVLTSSLDGNLVGSTCYFIVISLRELLRVSYSYPVLLLSFLPAAAGI